MYEEEITYLISFVSETTDMHPQTIRYYERIGLVKPKRSRGNIRHYSKKDIERLEQIAAFTEMGVNLAGVEIILKLLNQIDELKSEVERYRKHFAIEVRKNIK